MTSQKTAQHLQQPDSNAGLSDAGLSDAGLSDAGERAQATPVIHTNETERLQRRLNLACSATKIGFWEYDFVNNELWVSDELAAIYGIEAASLTWEEFVSRLHPDDLVSDLSTPTPSFPLGEANEFLLRVRHADGNFRTVRSRSVTVGAGQTPTHKIGVHIDMSQDHLLRLNDELAEANERLRSFAYIASHDLRSPVRGIGLLLSMLTEICGDQLPEPALALVEKAERRVEMMQDLVTDLQQYAMSDLETIRPVSCDVDRLLHDVVESLQSGPQTVRLHSSIAGMSSIVVSPLSICVRNLIDNALKHHDRSDGFVSVDALAEDSWLSITVSDNGPGIPENEYTKIFEPFYTTDSDYGTGLGLAQVDRTVKKYGASLSFESAVGQGTTFRLRWPVAARS